MDTARARKAKPPGQSMFRLDVKEPCEGPDKTICLPPRNHFVPRKAHRKSRQGCSSCKSRRIKCDEGKPRCGKCTKLGWQCSYGALPRNGSGGNSATSFGSRTLEPQPQIFDPGDLAVTNIQKDLIRLLSRSTIDYTSDSDERAPYLSFGAFRSLQHFQTTTAMTLGSSSVQKVMSQSVANVAWSHPYLMHMLLAVSYAHQRRCYAATPESKRLVFLEAIHWQSGLQGYRQYISTAERPIDGQDFEAVVATTFLAIIFTFALEDQISLDTFSGDDDQPLRHVLDPLAATGGFRAVQSILGSANVDSQWMPILRATDDSLRTFTKDRPGTDGIPILLARLCGMGEDSSAQNNCYHRIVSLLTPVMRLEPTSKNFPILLAFSGRTWQEFRPLLLRKDPKALLLLSYWLALFHQVDQWWVLRRVRTATAAIVQYLSSLEDPSMVPLLAFPASFAAGNDHAARQHLWEVLE